MESPHLLFRKGVEGLQGVNASARVEAAAKSLKCTPEYIYMIMSGSRRPSRDLAALIEEKFSVPMAHWAKPVRRRRRKAASQ